MRSFLPRLSLFLFVVSLVAGVVGLAGCTGTTINPRGFAPASLADADMLRADHDAAIAALRTHVDDADAAIRKDIDETRTAGQKAYDKAITDGKSAIEAMAELWRAEAKESDQRTAAAIAAAKGKAEEAESTASNAKVVAESSGGAGGALVNALGGHLPGWLDWIITATAGLLGIGGATKASVNRSRDKSRAVALAKVAAPKPPTPAA